VEFLMKQLKDADKQLVQCMQQIKFMAEEKELMWKHLEDLQETAQVVVDMVDPLGEVVVDNRTLLERLREAPQKIASYVSETTMTYVAHVLGLVKSFWPNANVESGRTNLNYTDSSALILSRKAVRTQPHFKRYNPVVCRVKSR
jgi:hypothetical protein